MSRRRTIFGGRAAFSFLLPPRLDALAAQGARLTDLYSGSPVCAPARCTLLTGLHTGHASIRDNDVMGDRGDVWNDPALEGQRPLPAGERTLAEALRDQHEGSELFPLQP